MPQSTMNNNGWAADISARRGRIEKALRAGKLSAGDGAALMEQYCYVLKDGTVPVLGMGRSGAADTSKANDKTAYIPFIVTTLMVDHDGDVVVPKGRQGDYYAKNPVWFFGHQQPNPIAIGTSRAPDGSIDIQVEEELIRQGLYFDKADPDAMFLYGKYRKGIMNATSIAFVPIKAHRRDSTEKAHKPDGGGPPGWYFESWAHTETSLVGVGANPGAIRDAIDSEKSHISPKLQKALMPFASSAKGQWNGWRQTMLQVEGKQQQKSAYKIGDRVEWKSPSGKTIPGKIMQVYPSMPGRPTNQYEVMIDKPYDGTKRINASQDELVKKALTKTQLDIETDHQTPGIRTGQIAGRTHADIKRFNDGFYVLPGDGREKVGPYKTHQAAELGVEQIMSQQKQRKSLLTSTSGAAGGYTVPPEQKASIPGGYKIGDKVKIWPSGGRKPWEGSVSGVDSLGNLMVQPDKGGIPQSVPLAWIDQRKSFCKQSVQPGSSFVPESGILSATATDTPGKVYCSPCKGTGNCSTCKGEGRIEDAECADCGSTGECGVCQGVGATTKPSSLKSVSKSDKKPASQIKVGDFVVGKGTATKVEVDGEEVTIKFDNGTAYTWPAGQQLYYKSLKGNTMARTKAKKDDDKAEEKEDAQKPSDNAAAEAKDELPPELEGKDDDDAEVIDKDSVDEPFNPKPSAKIAAQAYRHFKDGGDWLAKALDTMDHPEMAKALKAINDDLLPPITAAFKDAVYSYHKGDLDIDADGLMDKCMKALTSDGTQDTSTGEAQMVDAGDVPLDKGSEDEPFAPVEADFEDVPKDSVDEPFAPGGGAEQDEYSVVGKDDDEQTAQEPATEEILERYRNPKNGKLMVRKVYVRVANGVKYLVRPQEEKALTDAGKLQRNSGSGSALSDDGKVQRDGGGGSPLKYGDVGSQGTGNPSGEIIVGSGGVDWGIKRKELGGRVEKSAGYLSKLAGAPDIPSYHADSLKLHGEILGGVANELAAEYKQATKGETPEEAKKKGVANGNVSPAVENALKSLSRLAKQRMGIDIGVN